MCLSPSSRPAQCSSRFSWKSKLSDHCLSSRNSWPMNSIGMPGAVRLMAVATRARLRPYHERGLPGSPRRATRSSRPWYTMSWFSGPCTNCQWWSNPIRPEAPREAGHVERPLVGSAGLADDAANRDAQAVGQGRVETRRRRAAIFTMYGLTLQYSALSNEPGRCARSVEVRSWQKRHPCGAPS